MPRGWMDGQTDGWTDGGRRTTIPGREQTPEGFPGDAGTGSPGPGVGVPAATRGWGWGTRRECAVSGRSQCVHPLCC